MNMQVFSDQQYRGKHIVMIADKTFSAKTAKKASEILDKVTRQYPGQTPTITYIPKEDTLILWIN